MFLDCVTALKGRRWSFDSNRLIGWWHDGVEYIGPGAGTAPKATGGAVGVETSADGTTAFIFPANTSPAFVVGISRGRGQSVCGRACGIGQAGLDAFGNGACRCRVLGIGTAV
ncbi:hypothetical protein GCM10011505_07180 [Tistrella bauzanensis]|uniref:Uncharacterized protein n=1 Tax=Tistrella bauzanensis TaxID=657419 RepID=A0ABQ1IB74_9PROT|nr:hypothetical protein [Tistrella bauzanensis]GGB28486.1 hypothetical protein GCM10011505_07180 [Tistrella bauzanensis]